MIIEDKTLFADGFNDSIIGTTDDGRIVYSKTLMLENLVLTQDMDSIEALEFLQYNTWSAYVGEFTPLYVNDLDDDSDEVNNYLNKQNDATESE